MKVVLVCGGRYFVGHQAKTLVYKTLFKIYDKYPDMVVLQGFCLTGPDHYAKLWAIDEQLPFISVPARWKELGKKAGFVRNSYMLNFDPILVVAFPGGKGTAMMVELAKNAGIKTLKIKE